MDKYTLKSALACKSHASLEEWIHGFLQGEGNNIELSDGLKKEKRIYTGPVYSPIESLTRVCGPEEGMLYYEPKENFDDRVEILVDLYKHGWDMPPLIVNDLREEYIINDGSHRVEALRKMDIKEVPCIMWKTSKD